MKLKDSKCNYFKTHVQYLGHLVSGKGIKPLPEKLESVKKMPAPTTPKEIKQFLGLVGYYRKFIPRFADVARPMTNLTKQDVPFECQASFEMIKDALLTSPILKYPDPNKSYTLFTDASKHAWACVLTQEYEHEKDNKTYKINHPITFASGLFKGSQLNWVALTKEAFACAAYNFFPNEHSRESPFFLMFGRDPLLQLTKLLRPKLRYLGNEESILSLESLQNIYQLVVTNLKIAREKRQPNLIVDSKLKEGDLVLIKNHTAKAFQPRFKGNFHVIKQKGNQVEIRPAEGGETTKVHVTDIKKIIPADHISAQLPDYNKLGRLTKLRLNPRSIPNLDWQLASELHPSLALYKTAKVTDQITATTQATSIITAEIVTKLTKLKQD